MGTGKRIRPKVGDIFAIPLSARTWAYGRVCRSPLTAFYHLKSRTTPALEKIVAAPVAFVICAHDELKKNGTWPVIGNAPLPPELLEEPLFFKKDIITGDLTIYWNSTGEEVSATRKECQKLECTAVWASEHVIERLKDLFAGRPNYWVEHMRP